MFSSLAGACFRLYFCSLGTMKVIFVPSDLHHMHV